MGNPMENKKQTAVEWLKDNLPSLFTDDSGYYRKLFEQAKEMEKEQIIWAYDDAYISMNLAFRGFDRSLEYYEKTYGAQDNGKPEQLP
jgi:hypothetical protein